MKRRPKVWVACERCGGCGGSFGAYFVEGGCGACEGRGAVLVDTSETPPAGRSES